MSNFIVTETIDIDEESNQIKYNGYTRAEIMSNRQSDNCYEYVAGIQKIVDVNQITISKEQVDKIAKELFTCPVCREIFTDLVQLKPCLHSYCRKCFQQCVMTSNKKCVVCRKPIETKRAAFSNPTINELLSLIIPDKAKYSFNEEEFQRNRKKYIFKVSKIDKNGIKSSIIEDSNKRNVSKGKEMIQKQANVPSLSLPFSLPEDRLQLLGKKRGNENDEENEYKIKKPKFDIVKKQTPLMHVVNAYKNGDYAIIRIAPFNNPNEKHPFKEVKLVLHQRTTLNEIAIYISYKLEHSLLPDNMYFIIKEKECNRMLTNFDISIRSIIECYTHSSSIDIYFNHN